MLISFFLFFCYCLELIDQTNGCMIYLHFHDSFVGRDPHLLTRLISSKQHNSLLPTLEPA